MLVIWHFSLLRLAAGLLTALVATWMLGAGVAVAADVEDAVTDQGAAESLGAMLFFDGRLSIDGTRACVGCHMPQFAWTDREPKSLGVFGRRAARNAPTIVGAAELERKGVIFRDGRVPNLVEFVVHPVTNPNEMASTPSRVVKAIGQAAGYRAPFARAFGDSRVSFARISTAIAAFVRTISFAPSRFSRFRAGEAEAFGAQERRGWQLFSGRLGCAACHSGARLTDDDFHATGTGGPHELGGSGDVGRFALTGRPEDRGAFRTPSLLNVALTPPYFHDGSAHTLSDVVAHYQTPMPEGAIVDPSRPVIAVNAAERADLLAFLAALDATEGGFAAPEVPGL